MILSVSRRTDIPSFYSQWFLNRLKEGYVLTRNPMNYSQIRRITLSPEKIDCIVFWTKDPVNMMDKLTHLDAMGYHYYFQFTLNPYGNDIERHLRDKAGIVQTFKQLSAMIGKDRVLWRYDPILLNDTYTVQYHKEMFSMLCSELEGYTDICTISFIDVYHKLNKIVKEEVIKDIPKEQMLLVARNFFEIGSKHGMELRACCEQIDLSEEGIQPAACIDKAVVERTCGHLVIVKKDSNQRQGCGCMQSVDIGVYNTCKNGCIYCYANHSDPSIARNYSMHEPDSDILIGRADENQKNR